MTKISDEVKEVLGNGVSCDGHGLVITRKLDRRLYLKVHDALAALGGKWDRKLARHCFPMDGDRASEIVGDILETGGYVDKKKEFEFFETPVKLAERMAEMLRIKCGQSVLEPSAGNGRLALAAAKYTDRSNICCIEIQPSCCTTLMKLGFSVRCDDFMNVTENSLLPDPETPPKPRRFHCVSMNPPFSTGQDVAHIRHAAEFLVPGGNMVAIASPHHTFAKDKASKDFRNWLDGASFKETYCESLLSGTFSESGTEVSAILILMLGKRK